MYINAISDNSNIWGTWGIIQGDQCHQKMYPIQKFNPGLTGWYQACATNQHRSFWKKVTRVSEKYQRKGGKCWWIAVCGTWILWQSVPSFQKYIWLAVVLAWCGSPFANSRNDSMYDICRWKWWYSSSEAYGTNGLILQTPAYEQADVTLQF